MPLGTPHSPLPAIELAPWLVALSLLGAGLAWQARRAGIASTGRAVLGACLPATLWVVLAALNPERPTQLALTPMGVGWAGGFGCGLLVAQRAARRAGCSAEHSIACYLCCCAGALASSGLFHWLGKLGSAAGVHSWQGSGLPASALLGGIACAAWCFRRQPLRRRAWLDGLAPALGLALSWSWSGVYWQHPSHPLALPLGGAGLALAALTLLVHVLQRHHGQAIALAALSYGIAQLSATQLAPAMVTSWSASVASWLLIAFALLAGWVWRKGFTSSGM